MPTTNAVADPAALFRLDGRVAIVTGASSGLGDRFARVLHAAGATVVLAARRVDRLDALVEELDGRAYAVGCDVSDAGSTESLVAAALDRCGRIDVLVNNAGVGGPAPAESMDLAEFRWNVEVNLIGLFALTQQVAAPMIAAGSGSIINIASILGLVAATPIKQAAYCASKGAVVNLTRQLGTEWARKGLRVNAIAPGWFPSEMTQQEMFDDEAGAAFIKTHTPMARPGRVEELDGALLYLASDASSYVTGQVVVVDGGWSAR